MHYVYILKSNKTGRYYIGETDNIGRRLGQHIAGKSSFGKRNKEIELVHRVETNTRGEAKRLELFLKKQKSRQFLEKFIGGKINTPL
ncbi:MAG: GIY-YIG nuclease family protein [Candidatus Omnitrophica bacterium]|nr:GIY-YIG nuclease family protein [Candidatus Omnitrophota bacterium]